MECEFKPRIGGVQVLPCWSGLDDLHLARVCLEDGRISAFLRVGPLDGPLGDAVEGLTGEVTLLASAVRAANDGPEEVRLGVRSHGVDRWVARFDGRHLSTEAAGGFTGRVVGVESVIGEQRLLRFGYRPVNDSDG